MQTSINQILESRSTAKLLLETQTPLSSLEYLLKDETKQNVVYNAACSNDECMFLSGYITDILSPDKTSYPLITTVYKSDLKHVSTRYYPDIYKKFDAIIQQDNEFTVACLVDNEIKVLVINRAGDIFGTVTIPDGPYIGKPMFSLTKNYWTPVLHIVVRDKDTNHLKEKSYEIMYDCDNNELRAYDEDEDEEATT